MNVRTNMMAAALLAAGAAFGAGAANVRDFGAAGDGVALDTAAVQKAIDAGGMVYFPPGTYRCGTLYLKSDGGLDLDAGARLLASTNAADYNADRFCPQNEAYTSENACGAHFIVAVEQTNITIRGAGTIDGNSDFFYTKTGYIAPRAKGWRGTTFRPSQMLYFCECPRVTVEGVRLYHSPFWSCFLHGCTDVIIRGVRIENDQRNSWNTDGIDVDCCGRVVISDCIIASGDDCITLRGNDKPLKTKRPCERVVVNNCVLSSTTCAIRVGVGEGLVRDCRFSDLVIRDSCHGISINNRFQRAEDIAAHGAGGFCTVRDVSFSDIDVKAVYGISLVTDWFGSFGDPAGHPTTENISFRNLRIESQRSCNVIGQSDRSVRGLVFSDITLRLTGPGNVPGVDQPWGWNRPNAAFNLTNARDVEFSRVRIEHADPAWKIGVYAENCEDIRLADDGLRLPSELNQPAAAK